MKKLLSINKWVIFTLLLFGVVLIGALIILLSTKVERSVTVNIKVDPSGSAKIITNAKTMVLINSADKLYVLIDNVNHQIHITNITIKDNSYILDIDGVDIMLPGENLRCTIIYGYKSLLSSLFSSGV